MSKLATQFFNSLHKEHLKAHGYKKARQTFSRVMDGYVERVQFQGSAWNNANGPWSFYINIGVEFPDLPARTPCRDFPATHCWARIESIVPSAPKQFDLPEADNAAFVAKIATYLDGASRRLANRIEQIRKNYERNHSPWIALRGC